MQTAIKCPLVQLYAGNDGSETRLQTACDLLFRILKQHEDTDTGLRTDSGSDMMNWETVLPNIQKCARTDRDSSYHIEWPMLRTHNL